jgi:hypothetical protein
LDPEYARGKYRDTLVSNGIPEERANQIAEITGPTKDPVDSPEAIAKAREVYRNSLVEIGMTREQADRIAGIQQK